MNSLAKLLLDSSCAAARVGPKMGQPRRWNSSTTPSVSGNSGPTTVRSGLSWLASCTSESRLLTSAATHSASRRNAAVAGSAVQLLDARRLPQLPHHRVFAPTAANDQNLHRQRLPRLPACDHETAERKQRVGVQRARVKLVAGSGSMTAILKHEHGHRRAASHAAALS